MAGVKTLEAQLADGTATVHGDLSILDQVAALLVEFDPRFEVMPGTKLRCDTAGADAFEATVGAVLPE